jgi:hypothetical protein
VLHRSTVRAKNVGFNVSVSARSSLVFTEVTAHSPHLHVRTIMVHNGAMSSANKTIRAGGTSLVRREDFDYVFFRGCPALSGSIHERVGLSLPLLSWDFRYRFILLRFYPILVSNPPDRSLPTHILRSHKTTNCSMAIPLDGRPVSSALDWRACNPVSPSSFSNSTR